MKEWTIRILLVAALAALGIWAWRALHPDPEQVIRRQLQEMAKAASFTAEQGLAAQAWHASSLPEFLALDIEVTLRVPGVPATLSGRDEVMQLLTVSRRVCRSLRLRLPDLKISLAPDRTMAEVYATGEADVTYASGEKVSFLQELRLRLVKVKQGWLVQQVETVKTLT